MSVIVDIADAVKDALSAAELSRPVTAERLFRPRFELSEMHSLHVSVVPRGVEIAAAGRGLDQRDVQIDVAVQKKLGDDAEVPALLGLVEEIADLVRHTRRFGPAVWVRTENEPLYSVEHLGELRQFTSVLTLTCRVVS